MLHTQAHNRHLHELKQTFVAVSGKYAVSSQTQLFALLVSFQEILIVNSKMNSWVLPSKSTTFTLKDNNPEILDFTLKHLRALNEACTFPLQKKSSSKTKICFQDTLPHSSSQFTAMPGTQHLLLLLRKRKSHLTETRALSEEWLRKVALQKFTSLRQRTSSKHYQTRQLLWPQNTFGASPPSGTTGNPSHIWIWFLCHLSWNRHQLAPQQSPRGRIGAPTEWGSIACTLPTS